MAGGLVLYLVHLFASMSLYFTFPSVFFQINLAIDQIYSHIYIYIHIELIYLHLHSHIPEALVFFFYKKKALKIEREQYKILLKRSHNGSPYFILISRPIIALQSLKN